MEGMGNKLRVALLGGFSEGKTSLAAAWLGEAKENMKIDPQESSDNIEFYKIGEDIELVDTPGLFGFKETSALEKYKDITKKAISTAHLVLYVMDSVNPIKASHQATLQWLFGNNKEDLDLLPRTVFILSKFDEIADVADEEDYSHHAKIKKDNVSSRLQESLTLKNIEDLQIVAVSPNPFGMGVEHWKENKEEWEKLSHIALLRDTTMAKIKKHGKESLVIHTIKSIATDVLYKRLPEIASFIKDLEENIKKHDKKLKLFEEDLTTWQKTIKRAQNTLSEFIVDYFSDLILQAKGTSLETISDFFEREIGKDFINVENRVQNKFREETESANIEFQNLLDSFSGVQKGSSGITKILIKGGAAAAQKIKNTHMLAGRDVVVSGLHQLGMDVTFKFKPWGAVNLAKNISVFASFLSLAYELYDTAKRVQKEKEFEECRHNLVEALEKNKEELSNTISNGEKFISTFFPQFLKIEEGIKIVQEELDVAKKCEEDLLALEEQGKDLGEEIRSF